jgi:hypothetical protein
MNCGIIMISFWARTIRRLIFRIMDVGGAKVHAVLRNPILPGFWKRTQESEIQDRLMKMRPTGKGSKSRVGRLAPVHDASHHDRRNP